MVIARILNALFFSLFLTVHAFADASINIITPTHDQQFDRDQAIPTQWIDAGHTPVPLMILFVHQHSSSEVVIDNIMSNEGAYTLASGLPFPGYWQIVFFYEVELATVRILVEDPPVEPPQDGLSIGYNTQADPYRRRGEEDRICCTVVQYSGRLHLRYHVSAFDENSGPTNYFGYSTTADGATQLATFLRDNSEFVLDVYHTPPDGEQYLKATIPVPRANSNLTFVADQITCQNGRYDAYLRVLSVNNSASYTTIVGPPLFSHRVETVRPALVVGDTRYVLGFNISDCLAEGGPPVPGEGEWTREDIDQLLTITDDTLGELPGEFDTDEPGDAHEGLGDKLTEFIGLFPSPEDIPEQGHPTWTIKLPGPPGEDDFEIYIDLRPDLDHPIGQHLETVRVILRLLFVLLITYKFIWMVLHVLRQY